MHNFYRKSSKGKNCQSRSTPKKKKKIRRINKESLLPTAPQLQKIFLIQWQHIAGNQHTIHSFNNSGISYNNIAIESKTIVPNRGAAGRFYRFDGIFVPRGENNFARLTPRRHTYTRHACIRVYNIAPNERSRGTTVRRVSQRFPSGRVHENNLRADDAREVTVKMYGSRTRIRDAALLTDSTPPHTGNMFILD